MAENGQLATPWESVTDDEVRACKDASVHTLVVGTETEVEVSEGVGASIAI